VEMKMDINGFTVTGADLDKEIELLVAKRLKGELKEGDQYLLDRLVARRAGGMIPVRRPSPSKVYRFA